jgi:protein phosphatase
MCTISEQQVGQTVFCGDCGLMFATRAAPTRQTMPAVPRPAPAGAPAQAGGWFGTPQSRPQQPATPPAATNDDEALPGWDEAAINAILNANIPAPAAAPPPAAAPSPTPSQPPTRPLANLSLTRLDIGASTSVGRVRNRNEDSYLIQHLGWSNRNLFRDVALVIVADGLGGHNAGDMASGMAITGIGNALGSLLTGVMNGQVSTANPSYITQAIETAIRNTNMAIFNRSQGDPNLKGMASTGAVVVLVDGQAFIGHVGDCRVYHWRAGNLAQVTKDQTLVMRMVEMGQLTLQQAATHPSRNEVSQAIGLRQIIEPAPYQLRLTAGDWLIVACDGLHAHVDARNLEQTIRTAIPAASYIANNLVEMAWQGGGIDNITVVAVRCY